MATFPQTAMTDVESGPAHPVYIIDDADLRENGGSFRLSPEPAFPAYLFDDTSIAAGVHVYGDPLTPIYLVEAADLASNGGAVHLDGGPAIRITNAVVYPNRPIVDRMARRAYVVNAIFGPIASFTLTPVSGPSPLAVQFTDTSTNFPVSWFWDFGDGDTSNLQNPLHVYLVDGVYTVTLTVTNAQGLTSTYTYPYTITVGTMVGQPMGLLLALTYAS